MSATRILSPAGAVPVASGCPLAVDRAALFLTQFSTKRAARHQNGRSNNFYQVSFCWFSRCLARRHFDRTAVASSRRHAFVRFARVDHRVGEPDAASHQEHESGDQDDVGRGAVAFLIVIGFAAGHPEVLAWSPAFSIGLRVLRWRLPPAPDCPITALYFATPHGRAGSGRTT